MEAAIRAPRGSMLRCRGWKQEAALRMLMNSLDPDVAERPRDLIVHGGPTEVVRDWECYHAIVRGLEALTSNETLVIRSGKPAGVFRTHEEAPRVLITSASPSGSWTCAGSQGIVQKTYETLAAAARQRFDGSLSGRFVVSGGMGAVGGAQPLAAVMNGAAFLGIEADPERIKRSLRTGNCDIMVTSLDEAIRILRSAAHRRHATSVGLAGNCADVLPEMVRRGIVPDLFTDQTGAHDPLNGYIPAGLSVGEAAELRSADPQEYLRRSRDSIAVYVRAMLDLKNLGSVFFGCTANARGMMTGFEPEYIRSMVSEDLVSFQWVALSGEPRDIQTTEQLACRLFPEDEALTRWIGLAAKRIRFQGLPSRVCSLSGNERARFALEMNRMVASGELNAPIAVSTDYLGGGSAAWPVLNALLSTAAGASWVSVHGGDGAGAGPSLHARQMTVADGTKQSEGCLERVIACDTGISAFRRQETPPKHP